MNQEQNNVCVDATTANQQTAEQPLCDENQELRDYYLRQFRLLWPEQVKGKSDKVRLATLADRITELIKMLTGFTRSWAEEIPVLQKACFSYLGTESLPRKERQQVVEAWSNWSDYLFRLAHYHGLLTWYIQYHQSIKQELSSLLNPDDTGTFPVSHESTEEGGA